MSVMVGRFGRRDVPVKIGGLFYTKEFGGRTYSLYAVFGGDKRADEVARHLARTQHYKYTRVTKFKVLGTVEGWAVWVSD